MLEIKNVSKTYKNGKVKAIDDISLQIDDGDIYGFIGPNGAGKSTTIKCIVGIHGYDNGEILLDGVSIKKNPIEAKMKMAYVADNPELYEHLTGIQYIDFVCNIYGVGEQKNELISKYANLFQIEDRLSDPIKTYSHGMKQKIALISALVHSPKLLILDEPFVGLDPKASYDLKEIMRDLCSNGTMIFFSSHVLEVVEKFCNKIAIIKDGKIIVSGNTEEIKGSESLEEKFLELFNE
ncbi:TPA: ABC transporter ATP-binding protein [Candidatus Avacholeplasma faecigallinarum]|nr:ABC transporter ATP-binding protein [Candidatus Avacholeplasma faecigallinarum]